MTEAVQKELERFRSIITKDWARTTWDGTATPLPAVSRLSGVAIACRHFAMPYHKMETLPAAELLRIASDVTGLPLEEMTDADGKTAMMWWPVRGEVGWLPYKERPLMWIDREWTWDDSTSKWAQKGATP